MPFEVHIERGKIREFARAVQSADPAHDGADAVIPPTFLTTAHHLWSGVEFSEWIAELGFDPARVLHGEEEFEFFGPPPAAGMVLEAEAAIGERWEREGTRGGSMRFARVVTQFHDPNGALVAEQRTTVIETARPPSNKGES